MRVLIAGLGAIGQRHARNLRTVYGPSLELLALRRRRLPHVVTETLQQDTTRDVERELDVTVFTDQEDALARRPDAVFVCTPSNQHLAVAQSAANAGCHLFIEKPLSDSLAGVEALRSLVAASHLTGMVGCQWRFHPCVRWLRDAISGGALGRILHASIEYQEYLPDWHPYEDYRTSYAARADMGGGVVLTQIHDFDLAWWLFGPIRTVTASGGRESDLEIDVEDTVRAVLEGAATVEVRQTFAARPPRRTITIEGQKGSVSIDLLTARITVSVPGLAAPAFDGYQRGQMFLDEVRHFRDCVAGTATPLVPLADGIEVLKLALAVKEAMRSGGPAVMA